MTALSRVIDALTATYAGRRFVVTTDVVQASIARAAEVTRLGAGPCFAIGARLGVGPLDGVPGCTWRSLDLPHRPVMESIHAAEAALQALPAALLAEIDAFDPDRRALVLGPFFAKGEPVAGRRFLGARPAAWRALDDKVRIDAVWDAAGVSRAPSSIVPASLPAALAAADRIDHGDGTVWAADARDGWHGGGEGTFPVFTPDDAARAAAVLARRSDRIRVMPFLRGVPCSIHGLVLPDGVVVLRPCEMLVLLGPRGFRYLRFASFWDPEASRRDELRDVGRLVGRHLARTLGYRGAYSVDGVMTARGFRPTELNPRMGAAMPPLIGGGFPMWSLHDALVDGLDPGVPAEDLEAELLAQADAVRFGAPGVATDAPLPEQTTPLAWRDGAWVDTDGPADATLMTGPGPSGGYVKLALNAATTPVGPPVAPRAAALVALLDARYGAGLGPCRPAWT